MKSSSSFRLAFFGILLSTLVSLSACGETYGRSASSEIDTATVKPSEPASAEVTQTTTVTTTTTAVTTTTAASVTTTSASASKPDDTVNGFTEEQQAELESQQKGQLMTVSVGNKSGYLTKISSKLLFKVLLGQAANTMDSTEVFNKITEMEDEYYDANLLIFGDRESVIVRDFKLTLAEDDLQTTSAVVYRMTFTADADSTEVPMEGYVLDLGKTLMSVSRPARGMVP